MTAIAYAALLRGVNLGRHHKLAMADLRMLLTELGLGEVRTYLQSGNAVFTAAGADETALARKLGQAIGARFGFGCAVVVRDHDYLRAVAEACPFPAASLDGTQLHVTFLSEATGESRLSPADAARFMPEQVRYGDRVRYLYTPEGLGRSKLAEALARSGPPEGVIATTRNWNTVAKLVELTATG